LAKGPGGNSPYFYVRGREERTPGTEYKEKAMCLEPMSKSPKKRSAVGVNSLSGYVRRTTCYRRTGSPMGRGGSIMGLPFLGSGDFKKGLQLGQCKLAKKKIVKKKERTSKKL